MTVGCGTSHTNTKAINTVQQTQQQQQKSTYTIQYSQVMLCT
jgi:hypothetical protein